MPTELLDSAIVIDHMNGIAAATAYIDSVEIPGISVVTWIEVMAGFRDAQSEALGRRVLASFELVPISEPIAEEAVAYAEPAGSSCRTRSSSRRRATSAAPW